MIDRSMGSPDSWDEEVDFVVLGSGGAALTGAVVAAVKGASVMVLEKTCLIGGTTAVSGGGFWIPLNPHMSEVGVEDNRDDALAYVRACSGGAAEDDMLVALVDQGHEMVSFLEERAEQTFRAWPGKGATIDYRPELPGARHGGRTLDAGNFRISDLGEQWSPRLRTSPQGIADAVTDRLPAKRDSYHARPRTPDLFPPLGEGAGEHVVAGAALVGQLLKAALDAGVKILVETPGKELLVDDGTVVGVRAEREGRPFWVRARRGVLVATGGFSHNEELKRLWLDRPIEYSCEIAENQGDGHLMGIAVGAQVANLGDAWWMMQGAGHVNRYLPHTMIVNDRALRFCNEAVNYYDFGLQFGTKRDNPEGRPRNLPAWMIFDTQGVRRYSALADLLVVAARRDSEQSSPGTVNQRFATTLTEAATLQELGGKLGIDGVQLAASVERFNGPARAGEDPDFHRGESRWAHAHADPDNKPNPSLGPLEEPPFYALEIRSGALATRGGLRVNQHAEVLSALSGEPIPGLYAAGNSSNCATPWSYPGAGATIGAGMTYAYIAAQRMATGLADQVGSPGLTRAVS
jgi:3-oxosteroid 1-dehydrogenase